MLSALGNAALQHITGVTDNVRAGMAPDFATQV